MGALHQLKTVDSIHMASATLAGCTALLTNDTGLKSNHSIQAIQLFEFTAL